LEFETGLNDLDPFLRDAALPSGWRIEYVPVVASTNDLAHEAALRGAPGRRAFVADFQQAGRGRQGRRWIAPPGFGLLVSLLFRSPGAGDPPLRYTMLASVALSDALEQLGLEPAIKWPNDLVLGGRKVAGILAEAFRVGDDAAVVVGCGVNVGIAPDLPADLPPTSTSLTAAAGWRPHRGELLVRFLERREAWQSRPHPALRTAWHARLWGRDQVVRAIEAGEELRGTVDGVEDDGTLLLRLADGSRRRLVSGELLP
jgi:BirA family biotin operon repressor/biotin-[acetyl-CoA-carboxylase] ligase